MKNKGIGAKVLVKEVMVRINPKEKRVYEKKLAGVIVDRGEHEHYSHTCSGAYTYVTKHLIVNDVFKTYAVKLDNAKEDVEGNNIIVVREWELKFLEDLPKQEKLISEKAYQNALSVISKYKLQNK